MPPNDYSTEHLLNDRFRLLCLEGYAISDQEVGTTSYYGYVNKDGKWYIVKAVISGNVTNYTYAKGDSGYNWAGRATESYQNFATTF